MTVAPGVPHNLIPDLQLERPRVLGGITYGNIENGLRTVFDNPGPTLNSAFPPVSMVRDDSVGVGPRIIFDEWERGVDAVSAVLSRTTIVNEWAAREGVNFQNTSEWVVTFPTKNFYVDLGPAGTDGTPVNNPTLRGTVLDDGALAPFTNDFVQFGVSPVRVRADIFDREERPAGPSPFPAPLDIDLDFQTNVISFSNSAQPAVQPVLNSRVETNIRIDQLPGEFNVGDVGMMRLELDRFNGQLGADPEATQLLPGNYWPFTVALNGMTAFPTASLAGARYNGLPVIGFMATFRTVPNQPGLNFVTIHDHGYSRNEPIELSDEQKATFCHDDGSEFRGEWVVEDDGCFVGSVAE